MPPVFSYVGTEKIKSLSARLKYLTMGSNEYNAHINQTIKSENLQFNLSLVISRIILNLYFFNRSKIHFCEMIKEYNRLNNTTLSFISFEKNKWVRIIAGEIFIPNMVRHFVWQVGYYEKEGKPIDIPDDKKDLVNFLRFFYANNPDEFRPSICRAELDTILDGFVPKQITVDFLIENEIFGVNLDTHIYFWKESEYSRHLRNEIASTIWLLLKSEDIKEEKKFYRYIKIITEIHIWPDNLGIYLDYKDMNEMSESALTFLKSENDLLDTTTEFEKIWLDALSSSHIDINNPIPVFNFNQKDVCEFIDNIKYNQHIFKDKLSHQVSRGYYYTSLDILLQSKSIKREIFTDVLNLLKDIKRPFLSWTLYQKIPQSHPYLIPYLLSDHELIPFAFQLVDEIDINAVFFKEVSDYRAKSVESGRMKNQLWEEMFDLILEQSAFSHPNNGLDTKFMGKIFLDLADKIFDPKSVKFNHDLLKERYSLALKKLGDRNIWVSNSGNLTSCLCSIVDYLKEYHTNQNPKHDYFLKLSSGFNDLCIETLKLFTVEITNIESNGRRRIDLEKGIEKLSFILNGILINYFSATSISVLTYDEFVTGQKPPVRGVNEFGFEIIEWGYLYLHLERLNLLSTLHVKFLESLTFDTQKTKYNEINKEQGEKIKFYLKSLMLSVISTNQKKDVYEGFHNLPVKSTLTKLEEWICDLSLIYSVDDISDGRMDVFDESSNWYSTNIYYQRMIILLARSMNHFSKNNSEYFLPLFFCNTEDVPRMLTVINILDSGKLKTIISDRIGQVGTDFIEDSKDIIELQHAVVEAVNSEKHWKLTEPLLENIKQYSESARRLNDRFDILLLEINLVLLSKRYEFDKILNYIVPDNSQFHKNLHETKQYFIALYRINNLKEYDEGMAILTSLFEKGDNKVFYRFHLYRAIVLKSISDNSQVDILLLKNAFQEWNAFINDEKLFADYKKHLLLLNEPITAVDLLYYSRINDVAGFDRSINKLSKKYRYNEEVILTVYKYYIGRDLYEVAALYINNVKEYFAENGNTLPKNINKIINDIELPENISRCKNTLNLLRNFTPTTIPKVVPHILNGKTKLNEFILTELVQSLRIVCEKKEAIKQITHEDRYNDYIQAILRFRFPVWGWSISDQPRLGTSSGGKDAGRADLHVQSGSNSIALIEAFIFRNKKEDTQKHILKCQEYVKSINRYYVITYLIDSFVFDDAWSSYQNYISSTEYLADFDITQEGFMDISDEFEDVRNFKIAKTMHGSNIDMFHIMVDLR